MMSLTPPGATTATYTYDALGRPAVRSIASASLTYAYIGSSPRSYATIPGAGSATYALIDADASRLALDTGGVTAWTTFDLHGDLAATTASGSATIVSALRHDAYGASLDTYTAASGATEVPWRYQDRLDLSPDPDEPLYDAGARRYRPSLGAFIALDTYPGSALNPLSLNRYLYAHANPTSLIDPTGHCVSCPPMLDGAYTLPTQGANAPVSAAAAQSQVADAASWAPAGATDPGTIALEMTAAANQARAETLSPTGSVVPDSEYARFDFTLNYIYREMADHAALPWIAAGRQPRSMADVWASGLSSSPLGPVSLDEARLSAFAALEMPQWGAWDHKPRLEAELGLKGDPDNPDDDDYYYAIRGNTSDELYYDVWSNIHYGYVGMSAGFGDDLIRLGHQLESAGSFDQADVLSIEIGIQLWQTYGTNLTAEHLHQAVLANIETYRQIDVHNNIRITHPLIPGENGGLP